MLSLKDLAELLVTVLNFTELFVELMEELMIINALLNVLESLNKQTENALQFNKGVNTAQKYSCLFVGKTVSPIEIFAN